MGLGHDAVMNSKSSGAALPREIRSSLPGASQVSGSIPFSSLYRYTIMHIISLEPYSNLALKALFLALTMEMMAMEVLAKMRLAVTVKSV